jgi:hypothetical protein
MVTKLKEGSELNNIKEVASLKGKIPADCIGEVGNLNPTKSEQYLIFKKYDIFLISFWSFIASITI